MKRLHELAEIDPPSPVRHHGAVDVVTLADLDARFGSVDPHPARNPSKAHEGRRQAEGGDVLFARISPAMENGKVAILPPGSRAFVSRELMVLRPRAGVDGRLIWSFLRQDALRQALRRHLTGSSGRQRLHAEVVADLEVPETPNRIWVPAVEAVRELDSARELRARIEGMLAALPAAAATAVAADVKRVPLGEYLPEIRLGVSGRSFEEGAVPILRPTNIRGNAIETSSLRYLSELTGPAGSLSPGDILLVRSGPPTQVGKAAVYEGDPAGAAHGQFLIGIRSAYEPNALWAWLQTKEARSLLLRRAQRRSDRFSLDPKAVGELTVPALSDAQQAKLAAFADVARELMKLSETQFDRLGETLQAHLRSTFYRHGGETIRSSKVPERPRETPAPDVPRALEAASQDQLRVWEAIRKFEESFSLSDLHPEEGERAAFQQALFLLEQLGLVVLEEENETQRWHKPDPELDFVQ